ncbi:MAG: helix-turn-helix transcriptional regulator [Bryobacterales bacterium]|nr:helix-turn-helix transcriptional regulator [Bryobacterales bacterium]
MRDKPARPSTASGQDAIESLLPLQAAEFHILLSLSGEDRHGYAIIRDVDARTAGQVRLSAGTLYRTIQRLLDNGLITELDERPDPEEDDERRRYYRITKLGLQAARAETVRLDGLVKMARRCGLAPGKA